MIGQTFSHYRILEKIGEGGMGVVYKAEDIRLGRLVAIKVLASHLCGSETAKRRFIHEAKAASAFDHPHIATVYEIDETPDGQVFIAMAYCPGETLRDKMARGPIPVDEALILTSQIASGLAEVHAKGIVHRDVKPGNVIVTESGTAKVVDFGLALLRDATKVTKSGTTVGTMAYMSPEQARGGEIDARSDIFSLGCVMYELITGRPAFGDAHEAAILYAIIHEPPSPIAKYRSGVAPEVQHVVDRMLAKSPDERYASMRDAIRDIDAARSGVGQAVKPGMRSRLPLWSGLFVVLAIGAAVIWKSHRGTTPETPETHSLAILDFREVAFSDAQAFSAGLTGLLQVGFIESAPCRVVSAEYLYDLRRRLFGSATGPITPDQALEVARKSGADVLLTGQCVAESTGKYVTWQLVDTDNGQGLGARRVEGNGIATLADGVIGGVLPLLAERCGKEVAATQTPVADLTTPSADAYAHYVTGLTALERFRGDDAIHEFEAAVGIDSTFALAWFGLARANGGRQDVGAREAGEPGCRAAETAWTLRSRLGIKDRMLLEAWLARTCRDDFVGAIETHREIMARWPDDREAVYQLAEMLLWIHMGGDAVPIARSGLEKYPSDPKLVLTLAYGLAVVGHFREAIALHRQLASVDPHNPSHWDDVGLCYLGLGLPDSADVAFREALAIDSEFKYSAVHMAMTPFYRADAGSAIDNLRQLASANLSEQYHPELTEAMPRLLAERGQFAEALELDPGVFRGRVSRQRRELYFLLAPDPRCRAEVRDGLKKTFERKERAQTRYWEFVSCGDVVGAAVDLDSVAVARSPFGRMQQLIGEVFPRNAYWWLTCAEFSLADARPADALRYLGNLENVNIWTVERSMAWQATDFDIRRRTYSARAHRMLGQHDDEVRELKELLRLYPGHYLAEYELAQVYDNMSRPAEAIDFYTRFLDHWSEADPGLVHVQHARERVAALKQEG